MVNQLQQLFSLLLIICINVVSVQGRFEELCKVVLRSISYKVSSSKMIMNFSPLKRTIYKEQPNDLWPLIAPRLLRGVGGVRSTVSAPRSTPAEDAHGSDQTSGWVAARVPPYIPATAEMRRGVDGKPFLVFCRLLTSEPLGLFTG